ncbi:hypothetical protein E2F43_06145 [Seongchinamella unica]|uniref:Uncharacterized protein n=1 Tax=Seongchinamella unica TaxID=2547392 RepID=A0A4R5LWF0_9GAMM|nr:hypothetical protein [Seongchinamella unica]TDG15804.1 hypothetical protein E2F43_06145 [Seongchinamella unica]
MTTTEIKETIHAALEQEAQTGEFRHSLEARLPELRQKLLLPEPSPVDALMAFVVSYAGSVPGSISLVTAVSKRLQFFDYAAPFLHMAEDYFLRPPEILPGDGGLEALLDEAFLAHRLLEEVNDHHIRHLQRPLLPLDMTEANLIVHYLLGDKLATQLEQLVQFTASHLLEREHVWEKVKALQGIEPAPGELICTGTLVQADQQIRLRLGR